MTIAGVLLAAGASRRFGGEKLLAPLGGSWVGIHAARVLRPAVDRAVAVVRPGDERLADLLASEGFETLPFTGAARGMGASLAFGVASSSKADGWLVALADMPFLEAATVARVAERLRLGIDRIVAPSFGGRRGHPVGFRRDLLPELLALDGDRGARTLLAEHATEVLLLECDDEGILLDVDSTRDLDRDRSSE
ncbi:MAG TPA: nucleotidyltransferase family protein [Thermoanaerobaculia bacterium]|nr:nucleotidyltransferase family protein [Thermoanaerobaculia bacterium]HQN07874.1 nucleotidyltransferase family protein [Thermoanaerobaculia bacterium]HQP86043.1 nucleotidyltransferase family protein [Thermoanaerobaculia bacterium]